MSIRKPVSSISFETQEEWDAFVTNHSNDMNSVKQVDLAHDNTVQIETHDMHKMENLEKLVCYYKEGIVEGLKNLKYLDVKLSELDLSAIDEISRLRKLEELEIYDCSIQWGMYPLKRLRKLKKLVIHINHAIGMDHFMDISKLVQLRHLEVSGTLIDNIALYELEPLKLTQSLEHLGFNKGAVSDTALGQIASLDQINSLSLHSNGLSASQSDLIRTMKHITKLDLSNNGLADAGAESISKMNQLKWLDISSNRITDRGVERFSLLTKLEHLSVASNSIELGRYSGGFINSVIRSNNLTFIDISNNNVELKTILELSNRDTLECLVTVGLIYTKDDQAYYEILKKKSNVKQKNL